MLYLWKDYLCCKAMEEKEMRIHYQGSLLVCDDCGRYVREISPTVWKCDKCNDTVVANQPVNCPTRYTPPPRRKR